MRDNTQLNQFKACPESFRLKYIEGLRKIGDDYRNLPPDWGSLIHLGLEHYYKGQAWAVPMKDFWKNHSNEDPLYNLPNALKLLAEYPDWADPMDENWNIIETEQILEFNGYVGKIDLVIEKQGNIFAVDHKTTKNSLTDFWWRKFDPNSQITGYCWLVKQKYGQCSGVIINALCCEFLKRSSAKRNAGFHWTPSRRLFNRNLDQINDWKQNRDKWEEQIEECAEANTNSWPKNEQNCAWCEFRELCISCDSQGVRDSMYEEFDPFYYLKEEK